MLNSGSFCLCSGIVSLAWLMLEQSWLELHNQNQPFLTQYPQQYNTISLNIEGNCIK